VATGMILSELASLPLELQLRDQIRPHA